MLSNTWDMRCVYKILYLNTSSIRFINEEEKRNVYRFPYFIRNQWFKDISIRSNEIKDTKESYQIPAICVVKMRFLKNTLLKR